MIFVVIEHLSGINAEIKTNNSLSLHCVCACKGCRKLEPEKLKKYLNIEENNNFIKVAINHKIQLEYYIYSMCNIIKNNEFDKTISKNEIEIMINELNNAKDWLINNVGIEENYSELYLNYFRYLSKICKSIGKFYYYFNVDELSFLPEIF